MYRIYLDCKLTFFLREILFPFSWKITIGFTRGTPSANKVTCTVHCLFSSPDDAPLTCTVLSPVSEYASPSKWKRSLVNICDVLESKLPNVCSLFSVLCGSDLSDSSMNTLDYHLLLFRWPLTGVCSSSKTDSASMFIAFEPRIWQTQSLFGTRFLQDFLRRFETNSL